MAAWGRHRLEVAFVGPEAQGLVGDPQSPGGLARRQELCRFGHPRQIRKYLHFRQEMSGVLPLTGIADSRRLATMSDTPPRPWRPRTDQFSHRLHLLRTTLGLTQEEIADLCGLSSYSWSRWEKGIRPRDWNYVIAAVCAATGVHRDWLAWGDESLAPILTDDVQRIRELVTPVEVSSPCYPRASVLLAAA